MINEEKVNDLFAHFVNAGSGGDEIKQIYNAMPYLKPTQQRVLTLYRSLAVKYDSDVLREIVKSITNYAETNRPLGWRFTRLIESMALYKHFKGYKANANMGQEQQ